MAEYSNGCSLNIEKSIAKNYGPVAGLLEDMIGSIEPPFEVSLSVVAGMGSGVDVKMRRNGPFQAEIVVGMTQSWDYRSQPGEWFRAARAIAGYMFSTTSTHDVTHWMEYIDRRRHRDSSSNTPYND
jgi:hypothetical protein